MFVQSLICRLYASSFVSEYVPLWKPKKCGWLSIRHKPLVILALLSPVVQNGSPTYTQTLRLYLSKWLPHHLGTFTMNVGGGGWSEHIGTIFGHGTNSNSPPVSSSIFWFSKAFSSANRRPQRALGPHFRPVSGTMAEQEPWEIGIWRAEKWWNLRNSSRNWDW
jgi:hypothetical protein